MSSRWALLSAVASTLALAAPSDCIQNGGDMECQEPRIASESISLCYEGGSFTIYDVWMNSCNVGPPIGMSVTNLMTRVNCFQGYSTGCPAAAVFPGWSTVGQSVGGSWCWNGTTTRRNGHLIDEFAALTGVATYKDGSNNCTVTNQPLIPPMQAHVNRVLACPVGFATSSYPNGDLKCSRCPDNSSPSGGGCLCNSGYVKDPHTRRCVQQQCSVPETCPGYSNFCGGRAQCVNGLCVNGVRPPVCDDARSCTNDFCSNSLNACVNAFDPQACRCNAIPSGAIQSSTSLSIPVIPELPCPGSDADEVFGGTLTASATFEGQLPGCDNQCTSALTGELALSGEVKACTRQGRGASGKGKFTRVERGCVGCNAANCLQRCEEGGCGETTAKATIGTSFERWKAIKRTGPFGLDVKCSIRGTAGADVTVGYEGSTPLPGDAGTCPTCVDCMGVKTTISLTGGGSGDCSIGTPAPKGMEKKPGTTFVARASASFSATGEGSISGQGGQGCASGNCAATTVTGEVKVKASGRIKFLFLDEQSIECGGGYTGCAELNTCGSCSCGGASCKEVTRNDLSCKVNE